MKIIEKKKINENDFIYEFWKINLCDLEGKNDPNDELTINYESIEHGLLSSFCIILMYDISNINSLEEMKNKIFFF